MSSTDEVAVKAKAQLVRIVVKKDAHGKWKIVMPEMDHVIYCGKGGSHTLGNPTQVAWLVWDLPKDFKVKVTEKGTSPHKGVFSKAQFTISEAKNPEYSDVPKGYDKDKRRWFYDVDLLNEKDEEVPGAGIDPQVVIEPDP